MVDSRFTGQVDSLPDFVDSVPGFVDTLQHYSITTLQKGVLPPFDRIFCGNHLAVSLKSLTFACVSK